MLEMRYQTQEECTEQGVMCTGPKKNTTKPRKTSKFRTNALKRSTVKTTGTVIVKLKF